MKKFLMCSVVALAISAAIPSVSSAQIGSPPACPPFCPPGPPAASGSSSSGASGGQYTAWGIIAVATYLAVLNPQKGSDSILANTIHDEWPCALRPKKDPRPRCDVHNTLTLRQQLRLRRAAGLPPH